MNFLLSIRSLRFWLELLALPFFVFLVIHLSSHGIQTLLSEYTNIHLGHYITFAIGILLALFYIVLWHTPFFKKLVPCGHDHCHGATKWVHIGAIVAFCIHFFPESILRYELIQQFSWQTFLSIAGIIGFFIHFIVDIIVAILLSLSFKNLGSQALSMFIISLVWTLAFVTKGELISFFPEIGESISFIIGAFFLSMFIHLPHKKNECHSCPTDDTHSNHNHH